MEREYTAKYTLKQILTAIGLTAFKNPIEGQPRLPMSAFRRDEFAAGQKAGAIQKNLSYKTDIAFQTLSKAIANDLREFIHSFDGRAVIRTSLVYINIYLSQKDQLSNNTVRIYKFLKAREKRYTKLLEYSGAINKALKRDEINAAYGKKEKLNLRLNSLKQIKNMGQLEFNRLLDDIIDNLEYNPKYAELNDMISTKGKVYQNRAKRHKEKWEN